MLKALQVPFEQPDVVTLTVCGNDLLTATLAMAEGATWENLADSILERFDRIMRQLGVIPGPIIINTIYDPTDGQDELATSMGMPADVRQLFNHLNTHIRRAENGNFRLADLERLFAGHGYWAREPWITGYIEPNLAGATAIAKHWLELYRA